MPNALQLDIYSTTFLVRAWAGAGLIVLSLFVWPEVLRGQQQVGVHWTASDAFGKNIGGTISWLPVPFLKIDVYGQRSLRAERSYGFFFATEAETHGSTADVAVQGRIVLGKKSQAPVGLFAGPFIQQSRIRGEEGSKSCFLGCVYAPPFDARLKTVGVKFGGDLYFPRGFSLTLAGLVGHQEKAKSRNLLDPVPTIPNFIGPDKVQVIVRLELGYTFCTRE